jgi:hypothetical protein
MHFDSKVALMDSHPERTVTRCCISASAPEALSYQTIAVLGYGGEAEQKGSAFRFK